MGKGIAFAKLMRGFLLVLVAFAGVAGPQSFAAADGKAVFQQKCVACHSIGEGKKVGPDLKGIAERRAPDWVKGFIQSPSSYFAKNDETAVALLKEFSVRMPDLGVTVEEAEAVYTYMVEAGSPAPGAAAASEETPRQYPLTLAASGLALLVLTFVGLVVGKKKVETRDE